MAEISLLYDPPAPAGGPDVIFVHGLGGHSERTWMSDANRPETRWPDWVGEDARLRVWSVGYDAALSKWSDSAMPLPDQGVALLDLLTGEPRLRERRLVFIGHSLGGLVIKTALIHANSLGVSRFKALLPSIAGIVFVATPHSGSQLATLARAVSFALKTNAQVGDLTIHNTHLRHLNGQFLALLASMKVPVRTYAETRGVPIAPRLKWFPWLLRPLTAVVVDPTSSEPNVPGERAIPLAEDHLSICKPALRSAQIHNSLLEFLGCTALATSTQEAPAGPAGSTGTRPLLALDANGHFVSGTAAVRRVAATLLEGSWDGQITVQHAAHDALEDELRKLAALSALTKEQGERLEFLRSKTDAERATLAAIKTALALTFGLTGARERRWGVPMNLERATAFIDGLFVQARWAAREAVPSAPCQLYVPRRVDDLICVDVRLPADLIDRVCKEWLDELASFNEHCWRSWKWPELVPLWRFNDDAIAVFLLPAIALWHASRSPMLEGHSLAQHWARLTEKLAPKEDRDPLSPYHWCLAVNSDRSCKDLAWLTSPPQWRSELGRTAGYRK